MIVTQGACEQWSSVARGAKTDWTGLYRQQDSITPAPYVLDVRRAAKKYLFVVVVMAWRAKPPLHLKLMKGLRWAVPRGSRLRPGGHQAPCELPVAS